MTAAVAATFKLETLFYKQPNVLYAFCRHRFWVYFKQWVFTITNSLRSIRMHIARVQLDFDLFCVLHFIFYCAQLLRVQSPEGTKRIELLPSATVRELYESIHDAFELDGYNFGVYGERNYKNELVSSRSQTVDDYKLKHGDMIFIKPSSIGTSSVSKAHLCTAQWRWINRNEFLIIFVAGGRSIRATAKHKQLEQLDFIVCFII